MKPDIPIKIDGIEYQINGNNSWCSTGLPVSSIVIDRRDDGRHVHFYLHIYETTEFAGRMFNAYFFCTGKKVPVEFMGRAYCPWEEYDLIKLHDALETELALAKLD